MLQMQAFERGNFRPGRRIRDAREGITIFLEQSAREHVYWVERTGKTVAVSFAQRRTDRSCTSAAAHDFPGKLLEQFKTTPRRVLLGTDSFWSGADFSGQIQ